MSLQLAAQHMASRGRGPDTQLVHMAPQEVAGLQALAKAHGGSLTINPDTGLAEAGFLSSILPTVIGAGLSIASGGTLTPLMAGMMTGAGYGVATGSLQKGLMAGLGAYGGAGLAGGLMGAGAAGAGAAATPAGAAASEMAATNTALQQNALTGLGVPSNAAAGTGSMSFAPSAGTDVLGTTRLAGPMSVPVTAGTPSAAQLTAGVPQVATATPVPTAATSIGDRFSQAGSGLQSLLTDEGRTAFMGNEASKGVAATGVGGAKGLMQYGLAAASPMMMQEQEIAAKKEEKPYEYSFDYNRVEDPSAGYTGPYTGERTYFNPTFTRTAADGGLMGSGPVQSMSDQNQAQMLMVNHGQMFAEGGETKAVKPVEENPYYTMTGQSGDAFKYLMGQMPAASNAPAPAAAQARAAAPAPAAPVEYEDRPGGSWVDDTSGGTKAYTFDPLTGTFTAAPVPKVWKPFTTYEPSYGGIGSGGGGDTGYGSAGPDTSSSSASYGSDHAAANSSDFGGYMAQGGLAALARGGQSHLGDYSDGGRLLRGPGDGVSDSIPASIGNKRPARLADGEFVVPARIVSELGNGSTEAGARKLYAMMDRVQKARKKSIGKNRVAVNSRSEKLLPA